MKEKHVVLVSRRWDNPKIRIDITANGIGVGMSLEDFLTALVQEIGSPFTMITVGQLERKLRDAASRVVSGMKDETSRVV